MKFMAALAFLALQLIVMAAAEDQSAQIMLDSDTKQYHRSSRNLRKRVHHARRDVATVFNVEHYGAVGDGKHDSTDAFEKTWNAACKKLSAVFLVPANKKFVVNNLVFYGPCQPHFSFKVDGTIAAHPDPAKWKNSKIWMHFARLTDFNLMGTGVIDGQGNRWWSDQCKTINGRTVCNDKGRPTAIKIDFSKSVTVKELTLMNSPEFHLVFGECDGVKIQGIKIKAPRDSPNTDGIDIFASKRFEIEKCTIGTGDDCVAVGTGSSNITIKDLTCGPGHGMSIGSLGKGNSRSEVSFVHLDGAKFIDTQNGLRIKTWQGGSGLASHITYENVEMINAENPILINQFYCTSATACKNQRSAVKIEDVTFKNIHGTSATTAAIQLMCSDSVPCSNIKLSNVFLKLTSGKVATCVNKNANGYYSNPLNPSCKGLHPGPTPKELELHQKPTTLLMDEKMGASLNSSPPNCKNKCKGCQPCKPKLIIVHPNKPEDYYPQKWMCSCHSKIYNPYK